MSDQTTQPDTEPGAQPETGQKSGGWLSRLAGGLSKSSDKIGGGLSDMFGGKRPLDDEALEELEELLITADLGPATAAKITAELAEKQFSRNPSTDEIKEGLAQVIAPMIEAVAQPLEVKTVHRPHTVLVVGVNGSGKTTT
ncbi:MAG: signal recognition particle receptor subunit alpha, partial [Pseudomonadota bacterium]